MAGLTPTRLLVIGLFMLVMAGFLAMGGAWFRGHGRGTLGNNVNKLLSFSAFLLQLVALWIGQMEGARALSGVCLLLAGLALFVWAWAANRGAPLTRPFLNDIPDHLVSSGPYRWVRHPFYSSYLLVLVAGWVASAAWWYGIVVLLGGLQYLLAARHEEAKFMASPLREAYAAYRKRTGMLLPNPCKRSLAGGGE